MPAVESSRLVRWGAILAATIVSTLALDLVATAAGALVVASHLFDGSSPTVVYGFLVVTYVLWIAAFYRPLSSTRHRTIR